MLVTKERASYFSPSPGNDRLELNSIKGGGRGRATSNAGMMNPGIENEGMRE
jgi:hypothetical protein